MPYRSKNDYYQNQEDLMNIYHIINMIKKR